VSRCRRPIGLAALALFLAACALAPAAGPSSPAAPTPGARAGQALSPDGSPASTISVPILMYHYIRVNPDPADRLGAGLSVKPDDFRSQMDWLAESGFHPVHLSQVHAYFDHGEPLPPQPVVLTFDDGYADFYSAALPILRAHGFRAVAYLVPGFLDTPGYLTRDQVRSLEANGVEVGSHTLTHPDLTSLHGARLVHEVADSGRQLADLVGHPVLAFCYPSGRWNQEVVDQVRQAGYLSATTTQEGREHTWAARYTWARVRVAGGEALPDFARALSV